MNKVILYPFIGVPVLVLIVLYVIGSHMPVVPKQPSTSTQSINSNPPVVTASVTPTQADLKVKMEAMLSASTDHYAQLLAQGKAILGTTQYTSTAQGTSALHDPNSPASKFSAFRNNYCIISDPGANAMDAYRQSSDMASSGAVDSWSEHINTAASDFCLWTQGAADWEIGKVTSTQLHADEQKVTADLAQARKDIQLLSK